MHPLKNFIVLPVYYSSLIKCMVDMKWIDTRKFYKVFYITSGAFTISLNDRQIQVKADNIFFQQPGENLYCHTNQEAEGYFCLIRPEYLYNSSDYLLDMLLFFPFYTSSRIIITLTDKQSDIVKICFETMINEERGHHPDKKQATILHLQMIVLQVKRAGRNRSYINAVGITDQICYLTHQSFSSS